MAWDFSTDAEWSEQLAWVDGFVRSECEPIDLIVKESHDLNDPVRQALIPPLQKIVKERGLWATHLGPRLGGPGYGQVKLALLNEILGRSECAPIVFGSQAPDLNGQPIPPVEAPPAPAAGDVPPMPQGPAPGPVPAPPTEGGAVPAAPSAFSGKGSGGPSVAITTYDPRTGSYVTPDGQVQQLTNVASGAEPKSWKDLLPI